MIDRVALLTLPYVPRPLMRKLASRYIAGETLEQALERLRRLAKRGFPGILDLLGEEIESPADALGIAEVYCQAVDALADQRLDAHVSVKPTHIGLCLSEDLAFEHYARIATRCRERKSFVRVEMEDHTTTDATLRVFERLRAEFDCVGIVLQSRLLRTPADIDALAPGDLSVRLVKGIYLEPSEIAHVEAQDIRDAYLAQSRMLLERGAFVSFATHDDGMAEQLFTLCRELGAGPHQFELQVLLGVREELWERWKKLGHQVRVYVPYGPEWRPYSIRRLRKNPEIFRHVMRDMMPWSRRS